MRNQEKNRIYQACQESGIPMNRLTKTEPDPLRLELCITNSPLHFRVVQVPHRFDLFEISYSRYTPSYDWSEWNPDPSMDIEFVCKHLDEWLQDDVKPYLEDQAVPDMWDLLESYKALMPLGTPERDGEFFLPEEKAQIRQSLLEFRRLVILNYSPTPLQLEAVTTQLNYLEQAVDRLNRFDWRGLALSVVIGIALNLTVDTEGGRTLFALFEQAFTSVIKLLS